MQGANVPHLHAPLVQRSVRVESQTAQALPPEPHDVFVCDA